MGIFKTPCNRCGDGTRNSRGVCDVCTQELKEKNTLKKVRKTIKRLKLEKRSFFWKGKIIQVESGSPENTNRKKINEIIDFLNTL